tara:strand:- start:616 stop:1251 length:636 start_codon:yes stop_codon:yes gene_type:complete
VAFPFITFRRLIAHARLTFLFYNQELAGLRDENALMRADIHALHAGMEAQLRAETETETSSGTATQGLADTGDDEHFGTPVAVGPSTPEASPAKGSLIELFESLSECESPKGHGRSKSDVPQLDGPGPSKGDGVIFLRGRAVRVEGTGAAKTKQRPPPPHRNGWASPARSSFAKKMLAQFEKAEPGGRTPFRSMTSPHLDLSPSKIDTEGE